MPKKSTSKKKASLEEEQSEEASGSGCGTTLVEKLVSSEVLTETRTKSQMKRQKKREKRKKKEERREEVGVVSEVPWEDAAEWDCKAVVVDDAVVVTEAEVYEECDRELLDPTPLLNAEEEKSLRDFLKTLDIAEHLDRRQSHDYEPIEFRENKAIETIPEEIFEEFVENQQTARVKDAVKAFPRTSPKHSPKVKRREVGPSKATARVVVETPPKMLYSYNGVPFHEGRSPLVSLQELDDGFLVINAVRDRFPHRPLDVIMEENSSDFSDASAHSETVDSFIKSYNHQRARARSLHLQPVVKETVKIFPLDRKVQDSVFLGSYSVVSRSVEPVVSQDVVKVELPESESDCDVDVVESQADVEQSGVEVVFLDDTDLVPADNGKVTVRVEEAFDVKDIRFMEDESESMSSSGNCLEGGEDGTEADVESELDSRRATFIFEGVDEDFDFESGGITKDGATEAPPGGPAATEAPADRGACSPTYSRQDSTSSGASNSHSTAKYLPPFSRSGSEPEVDDSFKKILMSKTESFDADEYDDVCSTGYQNKTSKEELKELKDRQSVKTLAKTMESDMNEILFSKLKVIEYFEEPVLSEATWFSVLENTKKQMKRQKFFGVESEEDPVVLTKPEPLAELAQKKILSLPCGLSVLQQIGCCSGKSEEVATPLSPVSTQRKSRSNSGTSSEMRLYNFPPCGCSRSSSPVTPYTKIEKEADWRDWHPLTPPPSPYIEFRVPKCPDEWVGVPTHDPSLLLGFSPSQRKEFLKNENKVLPTQDEAANLLDLHQKFLERRCYYETKSERQVVFDSRESIDKTAKPTVKSVEQKTDDSVSNKTIGQPPNEIGMGPTEAKEKERVWDAEGPRQGRSIAERDSESETARKSVESRGAGSGADLAGRQNGTSDGHVPELNTNSSIGSSCASHEVSVVQNRSAMLDIWQKQRKFGTVSKNIEEVFERDQQNMVEFWEKQHQLERRVTSKSETAQKNDDQNDEQEAVAAASRGDHVTDHKFLKEFQNSKKSGTKEGEGGIVTETPPSVSDIIKAFEAPRPERVTTREDVETSKFEVMSEKYRISKKGDIAVIENGDVKKKNQSAVTGEEAFKQQMYDEYMSKLAERVERRQQNAIRISQSGEVTSPEPEARHNIEAEFITKVKERMDKAVMFDSFEKKCQEFATFWERHVSEVERARKNSGSESSKRSSVILDKGSDVAALPRHLQELLETETDGVWSPAQQDQPEERKEGEEPVVVSEERKKIEDEPIPPVWTPKSAQASPVLERKEFRPVAFESPTLPRKKLPNEVTNGALPPWQQPGSDKPFEPQRTPSSPGLSLPRVPNATVTLLQRAREGQLPRGAHYLNNTSHTMPEYYSELQERQEMQEREERQERVSLERGRVNHNEVLFSVKNDAERPKRIELAPRKFTGIGPTTREGIPLAIRSEVTEENKERWYKRMYESLHRPGKDDDYVTVKYRTSPGKRGVYGYHSGPGTGGYQSEPEPFSYDPDPTNKYVTLDRRRTQKNRENDYISATLPRSRGGTPRYGAEAYKTQPGRIENYEPGHSSISDIEANKEKQRWAMHFHPPGVVNGVMWWDEVLEIFDRWLESHPGVKGDDARRLLADAILRRTEEKSQLVHKTQSPKSFMTYALKESGYESDPQHVYRRRDDEYQSPLSPQEQKEAYRTIQKGGEVPLKGLRKPAPERPKDDTEIEYFPLSPTLTRIRVHKQNITPLSEFPFLSFPVSYQHATLNYPQLPVGVCSAYSQVQIFPQHVPETVCTRKGNLYQFSRPPDLANAGSVQPVRLQNISEGNNYVQIVPQPRSHPHRVPEYANLPVRAHSCSPRPPPPPRKTTPPKKPDATFYDLKRTAPSLVPDVPLTGKVIHSKPKKTASEKPKKSLQKRSVSTPQLATRKPEARSRSSSTDVPKKVVKKSETSKDSRRTSKAKVPLSESTLREKPLLKTQKRLKTFTENLKKKKIEPKTEAPSLDKKSKKDLIDYLSKFVESELGSGYVEVTSLEDPLTETVTIEEVREESPPKDMNPIYDSVNPNFGVKRKVEQDVTEAFRSRSFSPDVRRKVSRTPDPPSPPRRKSSKNNSTLRMWSKMMVTYPYHRSRLDAFDSNVKFLKERLRRRFDRTSEDRENESEFGDDIETVRTVRRDKNGSMSIKTNRYLKITRPLSSGPALTPAKYDQNGRRVVSEPRPKPTTSKSPRKASDTSSASKSTSPETKKTPLKSKDKMDAVVKSSTTYSVRNAANQEEDKRKSVKVTVAISSKGKDVLRKSSSLNSPTKKGSVSSKVSSPSPSISSYRSGLSGRSLLSEKDSLTSSPGRGASPQSRVLSPNSSTSRISSPTRTPSPGSVVSSEKGKKLDIKTKKTAPVKSALSPPITMTFAGAKEAKPEKKDAAKKPAVKSAATITKSPGKKLLAQMTSLAKSGGSKEDIKRKLKKSGRNSDEGGMEKKLKKNGNGKTKNGHKKKIEKRPEKNEVMEGSNLVRTDSFFQNLFLRGPPDKRLVANVERTSSVLERARRYQTSIERPQAHKSEPSLALVTVYLSQKRPVSSSKFKAYDRELSSSRSPSPYSGGRSQSFQMKLRRFDSNQFGDDHDYPSFSPREQSPDTKVRSLSEPPLTRSQTNSPDEGAVVEKPPSKMSDVSSLRTSPTPSRSPSCRRIRNVRTSLRHVDIRKKGIRARSAGEVDDSKSGSYLGPGSSLAQSTSSLNLSNLSDHAEYQAYVMELMHSTKKCERFRELHKFYSSLERMGELEKTASIGDLRPRMKNEEIIDYDRWKKLRTKERAEAELKTLVGKLTEIQKEKDLVFRTADVEAVRWKGDRGLRIKERSVEDLKEQFIKYAVEDTELDAGRKKELAAKKDHYKPLWRGNSIVNLATNLNTTMASHRGRPITKEDMLKIEAAKEKITKKLTGKPNRGWSSLSNEQVNVLKNQLSEIYSQELKKKGLGLDVNLAGITENFEITVPEDSGLRSPGEKGLYVRCNSLLSKDQMYLPVVTRKEEMRGEAKKAESISALPAWKNKPDAPSERKVVGLLELPWKEEFDEQSFTRTQSETKGSKLGRGAVARAQSASAVTKPLSESEKKRLSMTLSKEVLEKVTKSPGKAVLPRETLGALAVAGSKLKRFSSPTGDTHSPRTCYSLEMSEDGKSRHDFLLVLTPTDKDVERVVEEWANGNSRPKEGGLRNSSVAELESASASSETSVKTVIRKNSIDVLKKVGYFEDLKQAGEVTESEGSTSTLQATTKDKSTKAKKLKEKVKIGLRGSQSLEDIKSLFGEEQKFATVPFYGKHEEKKSQVQIKEKSEEFAALKQLFEDQRWSSSALRQHSTSPSGFRSFPSISSNDSLFSLRSRSVSPDPTKYYRAYLRMVRCGAVRKLCNKFESLEDLFYLTADRDLMLPAPPKRFASDPELTRDMLHRYGTDPNKVTVRGHEIGDVRWLRTKYEKEGSARGRSRFRRVRVSSPMLKAPFAAGDRFMPRINVISKTAELQLQKLKPAKPQSPSPSRLLELPGSPEGYTSLIDYTKDHGGYYYTGEVEKLKRKFEKLHEVEKLSLLGQMYTSTPEVNELRDIAPYLGCTWVAHQHPEVVRSGSSPELTGRRSERPALKPRPHSSSPIRPKQPSSILKSTYPPRDVFANQKFDPAMHRPKYRYQPDARLDAYFDRRFKWSDDWWRHWARPTVTFQESPRKYVESEVTIHYKSPVRSETKEILSEEELSRRQAEAMRRIYQEERRRKYLQELQDMNSRRHADNFTPSQKSPIPLNRYDDFFDDMSPSSLRARTPESRLVARAVFNFTGQTPRELSFRRGDTIAVRRQVDKNWCEGELNGSIGIFPVNHVEMIPCDGMRTTPKKPSEGQARAKFNFVAQSQLELSLVKGELVVLTRRVDDNWFEGRVGNRRGIFPVSYVEVLIPPGSERSPAQNKPVASPAAHSLLLNGQSAQQSMGPHHYTPLYSGTGYQGLKTATSPTWRGPLHIDTQSEPVLYRVLYSYKPINLDELELVEGDTVLVMEKCDDGWYVGSSQRSGQFGTFPGNYVQRLT